MITVEELKHWIFNPFNYNLNAIANYANANGQELEEVLDDLPRHYL